MVLHDFYVRQPSPPRSCEWATEDRQPLNSLFTTIQPMQMYGVQTYTLWQVTIVQSSQHCCDESQER
jgi:hypothetical protein